MRNIILVILGIVWVENVATLLIFPKLGKYKLDDTLDYKY